MSRPVPLKHMKATEASAERSRHRVQIGHLVLQRMRDDLYPGEIADIEAKLVKRRRRVARLDRRLSELRKQAAYVLTDADAAIQPIDWHGA